MRCVRADVREWVPDRAFDLWHDRATLHFLVDDAERDRYLRTLRRALGQGAALVVGTFAPDAPETCSGLPVRRYSADELGRILGDDFMLVETRREEHVTPRGVAQPFTWVAGRLGYGSQPST